MATGVEDFDRSLSYALQRLECAAMTPKPEQIACVKSIYEGKDVFLWLPTGFGKSLCYEVLPFVFDMKLGRLADSNTNSVVIVVSPLVSLMIDQVRSLKSRGVKAAIMSSASGAEKGLLATDEDLCNSSLLFCAPEAIVLGKWREALEKPELSGRVVAVIIDEAHCVSKWYVKINNSYITWILNNIMSL
jgi:ATP-dependent DNA helicase RecQ